MTQEATGAGTTVEEVDPQEALREGSPVKTTSTDQTPGSSTSEDKGPKDVIDTIQPKAEPKSWVISGGGKKETYVQRPLAFFAKMQFFGLIGEVIDKSISGEDGLRLSSLFEMPGRGGSFSAADFRDADTFVQGVGKLLTYAPDLLEKCYCIWLGIPDHEREWAIACMNRPVDEGGLSDDQGIEVVEVFIDQNWDSIEDFFRERIATLRDRVQARRKTAEEEATDE